MKKMVAVFALALAVFVSAHPAEAQAGKVHRIGYLSPNRSPRARDKAFFKSLRDLGWVEGKNIAIEYWWAARKRDRYPAMAEELVRLKVDLIDDYPPCACRLLDGQRFEV